MLGRRTGELFRKWNFLYLNCGDAYMGLLIVNTCQSVLFIVSKLCLKNYFKEPGTVAHAYNPNYSRGGDQEDLSLRSAWQKVSKTNKQGLVVCALHPSYAGGQS
jgi:hypothetical protein